MEISKIVMTSVSFISILICMYVFTKMYRSNSIKSSSVNTHVDGMKRLTVIWGVVFFVISTGILYRLDVDFGFHLPFSPFSDQLYNILLVTFPIGLLLATHIQSLVFHKSFVCPSCPQAIFYFSDWKCQSCGALNKKSLINAKCEKCGNKLTAIKCPNCSKKIEFNKVYNGKK